MLLLLCLFVRLLLLLLAVLLFLYRRLCIFVSSGWCVTKRSPCLSIASNCCPLQLLLLLRLLLLLVLVLPNTVLA